MTFLLGSSTSMLAFKATIREVRARTPLTQCS